MKHERGELTPKRIRAQQIAIEFVEDNLNVSSITLDDTFDQLGADSVDLIALEIDVEDLTGQEIEAGTFQGKTVGDFAVFIEERIQ